MTIIKEIIIIKIKMQIKTIVKGLTTGASTKEIIVIEHNGTIKTKKLRKKRHECFNITKC